MKAHINLSKSTRKEIKRLCEQDYNKFTQRYLKLVCVALNENFGFGQQRLKKLMNDIKNLSDEHKQDELFWFHIDRIAIEQIGLPFEREEFERFDDEI